MLNQLLSARSLPSLCSREQMLDILQREEYGYLPPRPESMTWTVQPKYIRNFCAGKATVEKVTLTCMLRGGAVSFPCYCAIPTTPGKHPFFIHINFRPDVPDRYMPTEEIIDNGFAVLSFCYEDVTSDDGNMTDGMAGILFPDGVRSDTDPGKIAMWAWASHRVLDYAYTLSDRLDLDRAAVCGHSRLGKTALLAAATDRRFRFAYSNDSGCSGAAITRDKVGEHVSDIWRRFPFWFCKNYGKYAEREDEMPFDQHFLIAAIAPGYVLVGSASNDSWADPDSELLACAAASPAYEQLGLQGFVCEDRLPRIDDVYLEGRIGYHLREGLHYFSRTDWQRLIKFVNIHG